MKVAQVAGFLGSGKTTAMMKIVDGLMRKGLRIAIVVNDVGEISVDAKFIESHGLKAKEISGGCICCQIAGTFADTLVSLHKSFDPDIVIVEPSGVAIPWGLKRAAEYSEEKGNIVIEHAPVITLVDPTRIGMLMKAVRRLVETQIREADVCFINKADAAAEADIETTREFIKSINPKAEIGLMSSKTGLGIDRAIQLIAGCRSDRYDESMEREMLKKQYGGGSHA
ncbi:MAG: hypothetical protein LBJ20_06975 [Candidatus Methanoplasma sp.]|jgi:G3E family GTPase|nr:hypothetical protein [Candidatus Methanoplasma sp.]